MQVYFMTTSVVIQKHPLATITVLKYSTKREETTNRNLEGLLGNLHLQNLHGML